MFTGLIGEAGIVKYVKDNGIKVETALEVSEEGESIAINGVCLTVKTFDNKGFTSDISPETLSSTGLGRLKSGDTVNLEKSLKLNGLVGGHLVMGHVDCRIRVANLRKERDFSLFSFDLPDNMAQYVVLKGSVAIDGISLTVSALKARSFDIWIIPETMKNTNLKFRKRGDLVNFEADIMAKYVERMLEKGCGKSKINEKMLKGEGFL